MTGDDAQECTSKKDEITEAQFYVYELGRRTLSFLKEAKNRNVIILQADKGGKTVIMDRNDYMRKAYSHLDENVKIGNLLVINDDFVSSIRPKVEERYQQVIERMNPYLIIDGIIKEPLRSESFLLPLFYGCPKVHKLNVPLRPIVASRNVIGDFLSCWLLQKLKLIANYLSKYNVHGVAQIMPDLKSFRLEDRHKLLNFDYVSMFTNVDVSATLSIIDELYGFISETTAVPVDMFLECLNFFIKDSTYFGFNGMLYYQTKGLAMGNNLA
ncbi:uncharacterized protein LOC119069379 [Bradysia coprophila]|uniref:uncharacterized protein LOC119069379 n=1 Tax=Bradysia coprophila TaxID=38358 RepID=UPI00187D9270|nr:uncharacterized protein LOC119069379 [Bradysia coprophila]